MSIRPQKKTILVADDDGAILDALTLILEEAGYEVTATADGAMLQNLSQPMPNLLLLDIWLSGWNGRDICLALKREERTKHLPIVLFSANRETQRIAQEVGADDFITKPFDVDTLVQIIERHLR